MPTRARRTDGNQREIVDALRRVGWHVEITSHAGSGFPDLVTAKGGRTVMIEVKDGRLPPSARQLTPDEVRVHAAFRAKGVEVVVIESVEAAVRL